MALDNVDDATVADARTSIKNFLSHGLPVRKVEPVPVDEVDARTTVGGTPQLDDYQVLFRIELASMDKIDVLEARSDLHSYLRDQFLAMERNSDAPDTHIVSEDHPPEHLTTKNLVFYVRSTL